MYLMHCDAMAGWEMTGEISNGRRLMRSDKVLIGLSDGEMGSQR